MEEEGKKDCYSVVGRKKEKKVWGKESQLVRRREMREGRREREDRREGRENGIGAVENVEEEGKKECQSVMGRKKKRRKWRERRASWWERGRSKKRIRKDERGGREGDISLLLFCHVWSVRDVLQGGW